MHTTGTAQALRKARAMHTTGTARALRKARAMHATGTARALRKARAAHATGTARALRMAGIAEKPPYIWLTRIISIVLIAVVFSVSFFGCAREVKPVAGAAENVAPESKKLSVVCTIFPLFDWTRQIIGGASDNINLTLLLDKQIDLHSYQPSVADIARISACDIFIYVGGESDAWVGDILKEAVNENLRAINMLETLGVAAKQEKILEGMEDDTGDEEIDFDEHIWLSLKNAALLCPIIADNLISLDSGNADAYRNNLTDYIKKINELDARYSAAISASPVKTLLFGDRFPFRYLTDDYGLTPYAAFPGCSAETEASFDTVIFLAQKMDELDLGAVMTTESSDHSIAKTIIANTIKKDQRILIMDSMQSANVVGGQSGATFLSIMENNLDVLKEALN